MSIEDVIIATRQADIRLQAHGDRLVVDAPTGALTPELRDELVRHKSALLARLAPVTQFVILRKGPTLPLPAVLLGLDLERRGYRLSLDECRQFAIEPAAGLTVEDRAAIGRWRLHLGALVAYCETETAQ